MYIHSEKGCTENAAVIMFPIVQRSEEDLYEKNMFVDPLEGSLIDSGNVDGVGIRYI